MHSFNAETFPTVPMTISPPISKAMWAKNCRALANFLADTETGSFNNAAWFSRLHQCGTTGCSLGIAAMSHIIPGLQFQYTEAPYDRKVVKRHTDSILPTKDGRVVSWETAGRYFFGPLATNQVFFNPHLNKAEAVLHLRNCAKQYRSR